MSKAWAGGSTTAWRKMRAYILERDNHECQIVDPGCTRVATHADHIIPKVQGGTDLPDNLRAACQSCNLGRKKLDAEYEPEPRQISNW